MDASQVKTSSRQSYLRLLQQSYQRANQILQQIQQNPTTLVRPTKQETVAYLTQLDREIKLYRK